MAGVEWRGESAFALEPVTVGPVDWLFSRHRLLSGAAPAAGREMARLGAGEELRLPLKFQGATDHEPAAAFAAIPGHESCILHHNKHELTFLLSR